MHGHRPPKDGLTGCPRSKGTDEEIRLQEKHIARIEECKNFFSSCDQWQKVLKANLGGTYKPIRWELEQEFDCDFPKHSAMSIIDQCHSDDVLIQDRLGLRYSSTKNPKKISHTEFETLLLTEDPDGHEIDEYGKSLTHDPLNVFSTNSIQAMMVVEGGTLKSDSQHPGMGMCIQRTELLDVMSGFTQGLMKEQNMNLGKTFEKICGAHSYQVIKLFK